jgi:hypothetical protein
MKFSNRSNLFIAIAMFNMTAGSINYEPTVTFNNTAYPNVGSSLLSAFSFRYDAWSAGGPVTLTDGVSLFRLSFEAIAVPDSTSTLTCETTSIRIFPATDNSSSTSNSKVCDDLCVFSKLSGCDFAGN